MIREEDLDDEIEKFINADSTDDDNDDDNGDLYTTVDLDQIENLREKFQQKHDGFHENMLEDEGFDIEQLIKDIESMEVPQKDDVNTVASNDQEEDRNDGRLDYDKFQKHFEKQDFLEESSSTEQQNNAIPDWLSTRRAKLSRTSAIDMVTPDDAKRKQRETDIPVIRHTLLSSDEIITCLLNGGAQNVKLIKPEKEYKAYLGWEGLIIATASSYSHIRLLTDSLVHNLKKRDLAECGVIGAMYGSEGGEDPTVSKYARRKRDIGRGKKTDDGWMSVDCRNYIVHVQDEVTRINVDLEGLWSPGSEHAKLLRKIDSTSDAAMDDFVARNPVPEEYLDSMKVQGNFWGADVRGGLGLKKGRKSGRFTPDSNQKRKQKNRGRYSL